MYVLMYVLCSCVNDGTHNVCVSVCVVHIWYVWYIYDMCDTDMCGIYIGHAAVDDVSLSNSHNYSDGSLQNDLPMQQLSELFNVNHFIVSQVNVHRLVSKLQACSCSYTNILSTHCRTMHMSIQCSL